jgi:hypothetical protein
MALRVSQQPGEDWRPLLIMARFLDGEPRTSYYVSFVVVIFLCRDVSF